MVVEFTDMYVFCEGQIEGFDHSSGLAEQGLYRLLLNSHHSCRITLAEGHPACVTFVNLLILLQCFLLFLLSIQYVQLACMLRQSLVETLSVC